MAPVNGRPGLAGLRQSSYSGRRASAEPRLGAIAEDSDVVTFPDIPPKAHHRPIGRLFHLGHPPSPTHESPPPPYSTWDDVTGPRGEKFSDLRSNKYLSKRGGWKRTCLLAIVIIGVIVGLVVGLILGIREKHSQSSSQSAQSIANASFPAGSYTFTTFLDSVVTDCTSNPATWLCFPYSTYNQSQTASMTTFNWVITATGHSSANYVISSSENPFALTFTNASLSLVDSGLDTEAYTFEVPMEKIVIPTTALTPDDAATSCLYNGTTFTALLYTKMAKTYPPSNSPTTASSSSGSETTYQPWPNAVKIAQVIGGGINVPDCFKTVNGNLGAPVTQGFTMQPSQSTCSCTYQNFNTGLQ